MRIIKPSKKEFIGNCSLCGCEFSYTLEELKALYPPRLVHCPECGGEYYHPDQFAVCMNAVYTKYFNQSQEGEKREE